MIYLVQQDPDFTPVAVWIDEETSYYPPQYESRKRWGSSVVSGNRQLPFAEFAERLAESLPSPNGSWNLLELEDERVPSAVYDFALSKMI